MGEHDPQDHHTPNVREGRGEEARSWWDRASDTVSSWLGNDDARRRHRWDQLRHAAEDAEADPEPPRGEGRRNPYGAQGGPTGGG